MKKEVRNQIEEFIKYNIELRRLSEEKFADKRAKDIVSFWIHEINFELYSMQTMGVLCYDTSKLAYGIDSTKLDLNLFLLNFFAMKDFYWYYIWNHSYCISAIKAYRKSLKSKKVIKRREKIFKRVLKIKQKFNK